jgi:hypothetical protein
MEITDLKTDLTPGDRVYVQLRNHVVKSGVYLGACRSNLGDERWGVLLTYDDARNIVDFIHLSYIEELELTIPKAVLDEVREQLRTAPRAAASSPVAQG